jgi:hypothetical protein
MGFNHRSGERGSASTVLSREDVLMVFVRLSALTMLNVLFVCGAGAAADQRILLPIQT